MHSVYLGRGVETPKVGPSNNGRRQHAVPAHPRCKRLTREASKWSLKILRGDHWALLPSQIPMKLLISCINRLSRCQKTG